MADPNASPHLNSILDTTFDKETAHYIRANSVPILTALIFLVVTIAVYFRSKRPAAAVTNGEHEISKSDISAETITDSQDTTKTQKSPSKANSAKNSPAKSDKKSPAKTSPTKGVPAEAKEKDNTESSNNKSPMRRRPSLARAVSGTPDKTHQMTTRSRSGFASPPPSRSTSTGTDSPLTSPTAKRKVVKKLVE
eukprot:TRINITY_DN19574_c0_g1_i1.p1 TRINITY_DN19574_c0_g1~~TRINITY_DN19574_c0_g1_i1.p1  ORF type:complete len:194 (-),score=21.33 TRINITY_DN19574_c0_g1_i1:228-809(-)